MRDVDAKSLTLANLSKSQADLLSALAPHYGLTTRPMPLLLNKQRLQLLKGSQAVIPEPELVAYATVLTEEDMHKLQAKETAGTFALRCVVRLRRRACAAVVNNMHTLSVTSATIDTSPVVCLPRNESVLVQAALADNAVTL